MSNQNQMEIEILKKKLEETKMKLEKYHCEVQTLQTEIVEEEVNKKLRDKELAEQTQKLQETKDSITNFNQQMCELYVKYNDMKEEHEKTVTFYKQIDERMKRKKQDMFLKEEIIAESNQRIAFFEAAIAEAEKKAEKMQEIN